MNDKITLLIASVLKPADDVRSCYKIGQSLAQTNKYDVHIIGFDSKKKMETENISLHPIFQFSRSSFKRLLAPLTIFKKYLKLKPEIIIVNTPELLPLMSVIKIIFGAKIIYDIQENYRYNIKYSTVYRGAFKSLMLLYIKLIETISKPFVEGYLLAEEIYEKQIPFLQKKPYIKLLNKSILPTQEIKQDITFDKNQSIRFVYSGTIGREYGTIEAIRFIKNLHQQYTTITLTIIGYSADYEYFKDVQNEIKDCQYIRLLSDKKPVAQAQIINTIKQSDIALLPYQLNPNIASRFPTKIYDYLSLGTPMIIPPNKDWKAYIDNYNAGIAMDFYHFNAEEVMDKLTSHSFYIRIPKDEIKWEGQTTSLINFMQKFIG